MSETSVLSLLPCPWCGSTASSVKIMSRDAIQCDGGNCGAIKRTPDEWNTRASVATKPEKRIAFGLTMAMKSSEMLGVHPEYQPVIVDFANLTVRRLADVPDDEWKDHSVREPT